MLPLRFNNRREILTSYRTPWQDELNRWRKNLAENRDGFADGMQAAYKSLVHSVANRDMETLERIVEPNLSDAFYDFFETLEEENQDVEVIDVDSTKVDMQVLDFV